MIGADRKKYHVIARQSADWRGNPVDRSMHQFNKLKIDGIATALRASQ